MKLLSVKNLLILCLMIGFASCEKDDDSEPNNTAPTTNTGGNNNSGNNTGGNSNQTAVKNTLIDGNDSIQLIQYTVTNPINSGSSNNDYRLDIFADRLNGEKGYWVIGLHELPTANTTLTSSFTYNWQNLPQGKFYFNSIQDKSGDQWWYTSSDSIDMKVEVNGDVMTLTCENIQVGDSFLPQNVQNNKPVTVSVSMKISDIQNATSAGTFISLVD